MIRKTYGVPGKIETVMIVKAGQTNAIINFKGGSIVDFARKPASYSTSDPLYQAIIENSAQFARGEIRLMSVIEVPDDAAAMARKAEADKAAEEERNDEGVNDEPVEPTEPADEESHDEEQPAAAADGVQTIEVACKADAVEWLKEKYPEKGYNGNNLRGKEAFAAACAEAGVRFEIMSE